MPYLVNEWLNIILRWVHVFAGILWIGQTYYFTWLDARLREAEKASDNPELWMVHSGGFYSVNKKGAPDPAYKLHWFKWEAAMTWLTGIFLLILVYYMGGLMKDDEAMLSGTTAIVAGIAFIFVGWLVYEALWSSPLARNEAVAVVISYLLLAGSVYLSTRLFGGRAAYMHVGAMLGTIMALNVWVRILPAQRKMVAAVQAGGSADPTLAARAKQRSKQNTFNVVPVVFIMLSNHFPVSTYSHEWNWAILCALILAGWGAAKIMREH